MSHVFNPLITPSYLSTFRSRDTIALQCEFCETIFYKTKHQLQLSLWKGHTTISCSHRCAETRRFNRILVHCETCKKPLLRTPSQLADSKSGKHFCSQSCSATFHNAHKAHGTRVSALELHIQEQIRIHWPHFTVRANSTKAIGLELDLHFPDISLAIEINGIVHYQPIFGEAKLAQIAANDVTKVDRCLAANIDLHVINTSQCKYLNQSQKDHFWSIVNQLLLEKAGT